jgi:hypothetical protein
MNKFLPDNDCDFVNFLQHNRPLPPKAHPHLETQLMELIEQHPQTPTKHFSSLLWTIPGAIAIGLVISWSSQRFSQQTPQIAQENLNLELFLSDNWETTTIEEAYFSANSYFSNTSNQNNSQQLIPMVESPQVLSSAPFK